MVHHKKVPALTIAALLAFTLPIKPIALNQALLALAQTANPPTSPQTTSFPLLETVPQGTQVRISSGSDSMEKLSAALQQGFESKYASSKVNIEAKATDQAIQDVLSDNADLAAISRPLTAEEKAKGLESIALRREKIAIVVDKGNPFSQSLTGNQFAQIFRGEITDWSVVGGTPGPIKLVDQPAISEIRQSLKSYPVFASAPFEAAAGATTLQSNTTEALAKELGPNGIGYMLVSELASQPSLKALQLHQTPPTDLRYPFSQPYSLIYARGATSPPVAAFLGYATGQPGQAVVARTSLSGTSNPPVAASPTTTTEPSRNVDIPGNASPDTEKTDAESADAGGTPIASIGIGALNADGQLVDTEGRLINSEGFLIDTQGELVDADGNRLAEGADGVLGAGIDPDAIRSGIDDAEGESVAREIGGKSGNISDLGAERGRWWWLLLPLAGLALLIWAASKSSSEEETSYATSTDLDTVPNDRIVSAMDSSVSDGEIDSGLEKEAGIGPAVAGGVGAADIGLAVMPSDPTTAMATTTGEPVGPISAEAANINSDIDGGDIDIIEGTAQPNVKGTLDDAGTSRITFAESPGGLRSEVREASESKNSGSEDSSDWVQRAKQRINEATEQMKQTAAETKDEATKER
ncbi:MAG: substrate-binding domain-containing protein [Phormidesmis sp.]